jgi:hypothetical protein
MPSRFGFDDMGIADLLRTGTLMTPANQRSYAWRERHVKNFLEDIGYAMDRGEEDYFLGTIVLIQKNREVPAIADGQQRIATTSIALARIRDLFLTIGREQSARSLDSDFLRTIDRRTEAMVARLKLNLDDNEYFQRVTLAAPFDVDYTEATAAQPVRTSNKRLKEASDQCLAFFRQGLERVPNDSRADYLLRWSEFLQHNVTVVVVKVPDEVGAYRMFETLNDRGLKASQADILKNYLFSRAGSRLSEAVTLWSIIASEAERLGNDENAALLTYLRHLWITKHGPTKEAELAAKIRDEINSERGTLEFLTEASAGIADYIAVSSSQDAKWDTYAPATRQHIDTLSRHLQVEQIKPLLFAVARKFEPVEAEKAFRLFVSWSVRFLIVGGRGGLLDAQYANRAHEVGTGRITHARDLRETMRSYVPSDSAFEQAFATARVSRAYLARYYLRALEKTRAANPEPEYVPNEEVSQVNLEHILPLNPSAGWDVTAEQARAVQTRLGNMALLAAAINRDAANRPFAEKKASYADSQYQTTAEIAGFETWDFEAIDARQARFAELAVATWPLTFTD